MGNDDENAEPSHDPILSEKGGEDGEGKESAFREGEAPSDAPALLPCPHCEKEVAADALVCGHCGESLAIAEELPAYVRAAESAIRGREIDPPGPDPVIALIWSFFIPGAGQIYKGELKLGVMYFGLVIIAWAFFLKVMAREGLILGALGLLLISFVQALNCVNAYSSDG